MGDVIRWRKQMKKRPTFIILWEKWRHRALPHQRRHYETAWESGERTTKWDTSLLSTARRFLLKTLTQRWLSRVNRPRHFVTNDFLSYNPTIAWILSVIERAIVSFVRTNGTLIELNTLISRVRNAHRLMTSPDQLFRAINVSTAQWFAIVKIISYPAHCILNCDMLYLKDTNVCVKYILEELINRIIIIIINAIVPNINQC